MKRLILFLSLLFVSLAPAAPQPLSALPPAKAQADETPLAELRYPEETFIVARMKNFDAIELALNSLRSWVEKHPSVESLFDGEWRRIKDFDLRKEMARYLDLSERDFDDFLGGSLTLCIGGDFEWAKTSKMLPAAMIITSRSPEKAQEFLETLKNDEEVEKCEEVSSGVWKLTVTPPEPETDEAPKTFGKDSASENEGPIDVFVTSSGARVIVGNNLDYSIAARDSGRCDVPADFLSQAETADVAFWLNPQYLISLAREKLTAAANTGKPARLDPAVLEQLGLSELEGLGLTARLVPFRAELSLFYAENPTGIAKILACTPTGLQASALIPEDAAEFSMGRSDLSCTWTELRRLLKIVAPATDAIYQGWQKQVQENYGVSFESQVFGSLGTSYAMFKRQSASGAAPSSALYLALEDPIAFQGGIDALIKFFTEDKSLFDKEKIANVTVYRLKSEFQSPNAPALAYAIAPHYLIVSLGDPAQMQELIENTQRHEVVHSAFASPEAQAALAHPYLSGLVHRPLRGLLEDLAAGFIEVRQHQQAAAGAPTVEPDVPSFDDVEETLLAATESMQGRLSVTLSIIEPTPKFK